MRKALWIALLVFAVFGVSALGQESRWHWGDAREHPAVVRIVCPGQGAVRGSGVVVLWNRRPVVLTAAHVVRGASTIVVHLHDRRWFQGAVIAIDNTKDLALIDLGTVVGLEPAEVEAVQPPKEGEELTLFGFGSDDRIAYDTGPIRRFVSMGSATATAVDLPCHARPGDSGGPVFNGAGKVVAVVSAASNEPSAIVAIVYGWMPTAASDYAAPEKLVVDPGHLSADPGKLVAVPLVTKPAQCGPGGCPLPQQQPQRRPGLGVNKNGCEINGLLPWNRQKDIPPPVPAGPDPATKAQLDAIQAKLNVPPPPPPAPPEEPKEDYTALIAVLLFLAGGAVAFFIYYVIQKK